LRVLLCLALCLCAACSPPIKKQSTIPAQMRDQPHRAGLRQHTFAAIGGSLDPEVSPDGTSLIFASDQNDAAYQLFSKRIDGRVLTQLTWDKADHRQPRVSPDGRWLLYTTNARGNWDVRMLDLKDPRSKHKVLASTTDDEFGASWSADGKRVAYCRYNQYSAGWQIWLTEVASGKQQRIGPQIDGLFPRLSPSASNPWILFQRFRARNPRWATLWFMTADGERPTQLLAHSRWGAITPVWDPAGEWIVFASVAKAQLSRQVLHDRADDIWMIRRDATELTRLTSDPRSDWSPTWASVDGEERIFFVSDRAGRPNIYSVRRP